ncbi:putative zinc finger CCHC domain-containing protein 3-like [Apostichopus japonicus]|uniref:Putative zinc finger CCHC domain-containing protein 3-like n=1 Tax=Stichopus japonicus TaxID=307972 RepID=A0A2G8L9F8_STIJA|nr:putative zinc finger CCHC domain-containing protein 3-like [Apostichopus japonicus]
MHDFLEGVIPFEIKLIVNAFIEQGLFTIEEFNNRLSSFNYGYADEILLAALKNPHGSSGQKAAQVKCLAVYLPFIIAYLIEETSDHWELFLLLLDIYTIVTAPSITIAGTYYLKALIRDHHKLFLHQNNTLLFTTHDSFMYLDLWNSILVSGKKENTNALRAYSRHQHAFAVEKSTDSPVLLNVKELLSTRPYHLVRSQCEGDMHCSTRVTLPTLEEFTSSDEVGLPTSFLSYNLDSASTSTADSDLDDDCNEPLSKSSPILPMQAKGATASPVPPTLKRRNAYMFDARRILAETHIGRNVMRFIEANGFLTKRERHNMVSILAGHLITNHGPNPSSFEKSALAQSVVNSFLSLEDPDGVTGFPPCGIMASRRDSRIVKLTFTGEQAVPPVQVFSILKSKGVAVPGEVDALQALQGRNTYDLRFTSDVTRQKGVTLLSNVDGLTVTPYERSVWVTVIHVGLEVRQELVATVLGRFGAVKATKMCSYAQAPGVLNGHRQVRIDLKQDIPSFLFIAGHKAHVRYPGQPRTCFRCGETGHEAKGCPNKKCGRCLRLGHDTSACPSEVVCSLCGKEGHVFRACPSSYSHSVLTHLLPGGSSTQGGGTG